MFACSAKYNIKMGKLKQESLDMLGGKGGKGKIKTQGKKKIMENYTN